MKHTSLLPVLFISSLFFWQCAGTKKKSDTSPFEIAEVYYQNWVSGVRGGGSGTNVFVLLKSDLPEQISLDSIFFNGKRATFEQKPTKPRLYIARFYSKKNRKRDVLMHQSSINEYGNPLPIKSSPHSDDETNELEGCIAYSEKGVRKYFKIDKIVRKKNLAYPSAPSTRKLWIGR